MYDVAIAGLGPAGRALASRCAAAGLTVLALDPDPDAPWHQTLSLWRRQLPPWLGADVLAHTVQRPTLYSPGRRVIDMDYSVLDNARLRDALPLTDGVTVERATANDDALRGLTDRAHRVIDCRGAGGPGWSGPLQTAYGMVLEARDAAPVLDGDSALFMDWRTDGGQDDGMGPTFLYAIPLTPDRVLVEETCLAGLPAPDPRALARRLRTRLLTRGVSPRAVNSPLAVEKVRIPLLPPPRHREELVSGFGTAGGHGHAATGYSVASMLSAVPAVVNALETGFPLPAPRSPQATALHRAGLHALLRADDATLHGMFASFGRLDRRTQLWFLDSSSPSYQVAAAMWRIWSGMPTRGRNGLARAMIRTTPRSMTGG